MAQWPSLSPSELFQKMSQNKKSWHENYYVMFSSIWGGFSTDPWLWNVPPDDHMVHRSDAVFESFKCVNGKAYCLNGHLERLDSSARFLGLKIPSELADMTDILKQARILGGHDDFTVRLTISRGPGSFTVNPYDSPESQLYLVTMKLKRPTAEAYAKGVTLATAPFPAKSEYSTIKSCDYLHNVLAKKYAIDAGYDYVVSFDQDGFLTEGATENVAVVTKSGHLCVPSFDRILKGVTLLRVMDQGRTLEASGRLKGVITRDLTKKEVFEEAAEVFLTTTSFDVMGVVKWDDKIIGDGRPGPITKELLELMEKEIHGDGPHLTSLL
ncbi:MAG: aminotransferase class IV [Deltaproteobacteria bacterium]|jgi:branched-chain amino acid aminotransferase|nr:aminotransferase class IV [Deltaproteobacteria bacterium]